MAGLNLPTNTFYTSNCSRNKKLEVLLREDFIKAYDEWIQQNDFNIKQLSYELQALGYAPGTVMQEIKHELLRRRIWKRDGKLGCICGFRTDNKGIIMNHTRSCEIAKQCRTKLTEKYFTPEKLRENLDSGKFEVARDYFDWICEQENLTNETGRNFVYGLGYDLIKKYNKEGLIKYSTDSDRAKKAMGHRASQTLQEKYGVKNASQLDWVKQKKVETFRKNWGADHFLKTQQGKQKLVESVRQKYGVDNISQLDWVKQKKKQTFMTHYNIDNIFKDREYVKQRWLETLGVENPIFDLDIREKALSRGLFPASKIHRGVMERELVDLIPDFLSKHYNLQVVEIVCTNMNNNKHYYKDIEANKIYLPDVWFKLSDGKIGVVEVNNTDHIPPDVYTQTKDHDVWRRDIRRYLFFGKQPNHFLYIVWLYRSYLLTDIMKLLNIMGETLKIPDRYREYYERDVLGRYPSELVEELRQNTVVL